LHSSIVLLTPVMHPASIKILCDSVKGIRSVSSVAIKVVAPLAKSMQLWRGVGVDSFAGVEFINAELRGGSQSATLISSAHLLAMVQRAACGQSCDGAAGNLYVFVGVETYAEAFAECAFALRRWFGPASVFALDMRRENPQASSCRQRMEYAPFSRVACDLADVRFALRCGGSWERPSQGPTGPSPR
jgi:hypothetical protein